MKISDYDRKNLTERVYEAVRNSIVSGELEPGSLHSASAIAELLSVSRTPVREAMLKLEEQGLLLFERNRGARILQTSVLDMRELISLRILMEVPSVYIAAQKIDADGAKRLKACFEDSRKAYSRHRATKRAHLKSDAAFHKEIAVVSGSKRLASIIDGIFDQQLISDFTSSDDVLRAEEIVSDHKRIMEAILAGEADVAANAMREHLLASYRSVVSRETGEVPADVHPIYIDYLLMQKNSILRQDQPEDK